VAASADIMYNYASGIIDDAESCGTDTNHTVVIVGYGYDTDLDLDYWLIRNSWGVSWGENGYTRYSMSEGDDGMCMML
jgi:C1A family cysteine protease